MISFVYSFSANANEARGCRIKSKEGKCCWQNNNGCCQPPKPNQMCTMAITYCCKTKKYNESLTNINTSYSCQHCAMNRQYKFKTGEKKTKWRIASGHCMTNANDKLPDEL